MQSENKKEFIAYKKKHDDNIDEIRFEMIFFYESGRQDLIFSVQL
jgi:hypothetical protein